MVAIRPEWLMTLGSGGRSNGFHDLVGPSEPAADFRRTCAFTRLGAPLSKPKWSAIGILVVVQRRPALLNASGADKHVHGLANGRRGGNVRRGQYHATVLTFGLRNVAKLIRPSRSSSVARAALTGRLKWNP